MVSRLLVPIRIVYLNLTSGRLSGFCEMRSREAKEMTQWLRSLGILMGDFKFNLKHPLEVLQPPVTAVLCNLTPCGL